VNLYLYAHHYSLYSHHDCGHTLPTNSMYSYSHRHVHSMHIADRPTAGRNISLPLPLFRYFSILLLCAKILPHSSYHCLELSIALHTRERGFVGHPEYSSRLVRISLFRFPSPLPKEVLPCYREDRALRLWLHCC